MIEYLLTGIELHSDKGFGVTGDAYYKSAQHLETSHFEDYDSTQQVEMPQSFLYRYSIELYLKSLIIIFHKILKIDYGNVPFDSDEPEVQVNGKWKKLYICHYIDKLYEYWVKKLLLPNIEKLEELAPNGEWKELEDITKKILTICKYDRDSSYFRYPITKNSSLDEKKYSMKKLSINEVDLLFQKTIKNSDSTKKGKATMIFVDNDDNIVDAYTKDDNILSDVRDDLREVATYFYLVHTMTRMTLCKGM